MELCKTYADKIEYLRVLKEPFDISSMVTYFSKEITLNGKNYYNLELIVPQDMLDITRYDLEHNKAITFTMRDTDDVIVIFEYDITNCKWSVDKEDLIRPSYSEVNSSMVYTHYASVYRTWNLFLTLDVFKMKNRIYECERFTAVPYGTM